MLSQSLAEGLPLMTCRTRTRAVALLVALLGTATVWATTLVKMSFSDLAAGSDRVVIGTVIALEGTRDESRQFIHTNVTISVERYVRGAGPAELVLRTPGGQLDGQAVLAHGAPSFTVGERVLVFLTRWEDGVAKVAGYVQGKSTVTTGADGQARLRGGVADGRSLRGVTDELTHGASTVPLRPSSGAGTPR